MTQKYLCINTEYDVKNSNGATSSFAKLWLTEEELKLDTMTV